MLCGQPDPLEHFLITQPEIPVVGTEAPGFLEFHVMCCLVLQLLLTLLSVSSIFYFYFYHIVFGKSPSCTPVKISGTIIVHFMME